MRLFDRIRPIKKDNGGFTFVELLIAVAIAAIFGAAVFGFMTVGAKTFSSNSADVNIQNESQLAFNQIQDLVIDTAVAVEYYDKTNGTKVENDTEIADGHDKLLKLYNLDSIYEIYWKHDAQELYYVEHAAHLDDVDNKIVEDSTSGPFLMSEYIDGFAVDLTRLESSKIVRVDLSYSKGGRQSHSSHNITLRNQIVSENKIEEHTKTRYTLSSNRIPQSVVGKEYIYVEPNENTTLSGYKVLDDIGGDVTSVQPLRFMFAPGSSHATDTTIGYQNGNLKISPLEKTKDFSVWVYCQNDNSIYLPVNIRVVRTTGITIDFTASAGAKDELESGALDDDLIVNEDFTLKATPNINWTVASVPSAQRDSGDTSKLQTIEDNIKNGIKFKGAGMDGYDELYKETDTSSLTDNPCKFKMSDTFTFEGDKEKTHYTKKFTVRAVCGYTEGRLSAYGVNVDTDTDYHKDWEGQAYKKKGDYTIIPSGNVVRGKWYVTPMCSFSDADESRFKMDTSHAEFLDVTVTEEPGGRVIPQNEWLRDGTGHANFDWWGNMNWDPNKRYVFTIISHFTDTSKTPGIGNATYIIPKGVYDKNYKYDYTSEEVKIVFDKLRLNYKDSSYRDNIVISDVPNLPDDRECDSKYVMYYAKVFGHKNEDVSGINGNPITLNITYNNSFYDASESQTTPKALTEWASEGGKGWYIYTYDSSKQEWANTSFNDSDKLVKSDRDQNIFGNSKDYMFVYRYDYKEGSSRDLRIMLNTNAKSWNKNMPSRIRVVPRLRNKTLNPEKEFAIEDNYVECVFWNIQVPYKGVALNNVIDYITNKSYETCFFPGPEDPDFTRVKLAQKTVNNENVTVTSYPEWEYAGFDKNSNYTFKEGYYTLRYNLKRSSATDENAYTLQLGYDDKNGNIIGIAEYHYDRNKQMWVMDKKIAKFD